VKIRVNPWPLFRQIFTDLEGSDLVIPKPVLSARNLLAAGSEKADSSRDNTALRNDKPLGTFTVHHYCGRIPAA